MSDAIDLTQRPIINPNKKVVTTITNNNPVHNAPVTTQPTPPAPVEEKANIPTEEDLDKIVEIAKEAAEENEDIEAVRAVPERSDEERLNLETQDAIPMDDLPEGVTAAEREFAMDASGKPIFTKEGGELPAAPLPIDAIDDLDDFNDREFREKFMENTKEIHNISDDAAMGLLDVLTAYRRDKSINVYNKMPEEIKEQIIENDRALKEKDDTALALLPDGFDVVDQLSELLAERKKLHIIDEENLRYNCDIIALEYAIGALRR